MEKSMDYLLLHCLVERELQGLLVLVKVCWSMLKVQNPS